MTFSAIIKFPTDLRGFHISHLCQIPPSVFDILVEQARPCLDQKKHIFERCDGTVGLSDPAWSSVEERNSILSADHRRPKLKFY